MAVNLSPVAGAAAQFFDNSGNILTGGKLYTYLAGTTTSAVTYTTSSGAVAHPNPIVLNAAGRVPDSGEIWLADSISYKFVLKDQNDVLIGTYDNLVGINSNFINFTGEEETQTATQGQTIFTLATLAYQPATNNLLVFVNGSKQISGTNYQETSSTVVTFVDGLNVGDVVDFCTATPINTLVADAVNVSYNQGGTGAVTYNVQARLAQFVSVKDFGAIGDGVADDTTAFVNAFTEAQANGVGIIVPNGTYKILDRSAFPRQGSSIAPVNILTGSKVTYTGTVVPGVFTSTPSFGASVVNGYNLTNYNYMFSAPDQAIEDPGALGDYPFGSATLSVDSIPGINFKGNGNAGFFEAVGVAGANFALGGINIVSAMKSGFLGNANCMELDLENSAGDLKGLGIVITGQGTYRPEVAIKILRAALGSQSPTGAGGSWIPAHQFGIQLYNCENGIYIDQSQVQTPAAAIAVVPGPQAVATNPAIYVNDPNSTAIFAVQNDGYISYRSSGPISSLGTNVVGIAAPQAPNAYLMSDKTVRLAGQITATSGNTVAAGATLATLSAEFRPNRTVIFPSITSNGVLAWIQVTSTGVITSDTNLTSSFAFTLDSVNYLLSN